MEQLLENVGYIFRQKSFARLKGTTHGITNTSWKYSRKQDNAGLKGHVHEGTVWEKKYSRILLVNYERSILWENQFVVSTPVQLMVSSAKFRFIQSLNDNDFDAFFEFFSWKELFFTNFHYTTSWYRFQQIFLFDCKAERLWRHETDKFWKENFLVHSYWQKWRRAATNISSNPWIKNTRPRYWATISLTSSFQRKKELWSIKSEVIEKTF